MPRDAASRINPGAGLDQGAGEVVALADSLVATSTVLFIARPRTTLVTRKASCEKTGGF